MSRSLSRSFTKMLFPLLVLFCIVQTAHAIVQLTDPGTEGEPVSGQTVSLNFPNEKPQMAKTDDEGILYWPDGTMVSELPKKTDINNGLTFQDVTSSFISKWPSAKGGCELPVPDKYEGMTVGPNDTYGSGKEFNKKATGMAMGALGGLTGGSGFGFGGGGSKSKKKKGPKTVSDPTSGDFITIKNGGVEVDIRTAFTKDGFVVSSKLNKAPGDGTFHAMWLEDSDGRRVFPYKYLIISIYRNWKLTVSWTYDHWTNGEHDEHREGGWVETGSDHLGTFPVSLEGEEGVKKSIWYSNGFDTAVNGIDHLGSVFSLTKDDFTGKKPLHLVTHITQPNMKPNVSTIPLIGELFASKPASSSSKNLIVLVKPHIIDVE